MFVWVPKNTVYYMPFCPCPVSFGAFKEDSLEGCLGPHLLLHIPRTILSTHRASATTKNSRVSNIYLPLSLSSTPDTHARSTRKLRCLKATSNYMYKNNHFPQLPPNLFLLCSLSSETAFIIFVVNITYYP